MVLKPLTAAELAILAAGPPAQRPPAQRPDDIVGWRKERSRYDGLVRRQKNLAASSAPVVAVFIVGLRLHSVAGGGVEWTIDPRSSRRLLLHGRMHGPDSAVM